MAKRKLNRQQNLRSKEQQQQRRKRALNQQRNLAQPTQSGELSSEQQGLVICRYRKEFEVEALEGANKGGLLRCSCRMNIDSVVTGDKVVFRAGAGKTGVIESCHPRQNLLERPDNFGKLKAVAANIDQMLIVIACEPTPQTNLIDRYLVAAELMAIKPIIVLNKIDLLCADNQEKIDKLLAIYQSLNYPIIKIISSRHQTPQLGMLPEQINQHTSIVVGQSGVGKSSLINTLLPDANIQVGELSEQTSEGTHTTTTARLFHLPNGGELIDSPGIRDFSLWHIDLEQLQHGFIDIAQHASDCRFRDCQHEKEPACAVQNAVQQQAIHPQRFASYQRVKQTILEQQSRGLKAD